MFYNDRFFSPFSNHTQKPYYISSTAELYIRLYCSLLRAIMFLYVSIPFYSLRRLFFLVQRFYYKLTDYTSSSSSSSPWMIHFFFITSKKNNKRRKNTREKWFNILNFFSALIVFLFAMLTHVVSPFCSHCCWVIQNIVDMKWKWRRMKNKQSGESFQNDFDRKMFMTMTMKVKLKDEIGWNVEEIYVIEFSFKLAQST